MTTTKMSPAKIHSYIISIKNTRNRHILAILDYNFSFLTTKINFFGPEIPIFPKFTLPTTTFLVVNPQFPPTQISYDEKSGTIMIARKFCIISKMWISYKGLFQKNHVFGHFRGIWSKIIKLRVRTRPLSVIQWFNNPTFS